MGSPSPGFNPQPIRGILLDLGGVVYVGKDQPIPGAVQAIRRLRDTLHPLRFITNTTRRSHSQILRDLAKLGLDVAPEELLTPAQMARAYLSAHNLSPCLLVHPNLESEFADMATGSHDAVVVGDAGHSFDYEHLNTAYRKMIDGAELIALAKNRNFQDDDGQLSLDAGPFVVALEYASGKTATLLGKPSPDFFALAVQSIGCAAANVVMIGDDVESDVGGAVSAGLQGLLVRTGKYRKGDEIRLESTDIMVQDSLVEAVAFLDSACSHLG